jgi:hypothetical protein
MIDPLFFKTNGNIYFKEDMLPTKAEVLRRLGTKKNTFAGNAISRVYDYFFKGAINFKREYRRYYRKEFSSVVKFIEEHFNIDHDKTLILSKGNYSMKDYSYCSLDRNIETLNDDEGLKESFFKAVGGLKYEDQDGVYYE